MSEFQKRGVDLVAVSVDPPEVSARLKRKLKADAVTFVSDRALQLIDALNLRHEGAMPRMFRHERGRDTALPTLVLVDRQGIIRWVYRPENYRLRAQPEKILAEIDRMNASASVNPDQ